MRFIVDFSQSEPLMGQNGTGQSGNPASPNYINGIDPWLKGQYIGLPMQPQNFERVYGEDAVDADSRQVNAIPVWEPARLPHGFCNDPQNQSNF